MNNFTLENINMLLPEGWALARSLRVEQGKITSIDFEQQRDQPDPERAYILPGIIDAHGDAFEREISPRSGTQFPLDLAIGANDAALIAAGITTFFFSITDGFEPGLRSRKTVRQLLNLLEENQDRLKSNHKIHIRHEQVNTDDHDELCDWLRSGRIDLVSLNNHLPALDADEKKIQRWKASMNRRLKLTDAEMDAFMAKLQSRCELGLEQTGQLVDIIHTQGIPLASHDDMTQADVERALALNVSIAEFPGDLNIAKQLRDKGVATLVGAPNLVRGGSHVGALCAAEAIKAKQINILCSDYHYASLFRAPFKAAEQGLCSFAQAWQYVSIEPAKATGIAAQTGSIEVGKDADFIQLKCLDASPLSIEKVWVKGRLFS